MGEGIALPHGLTRCFHAAPPSTASITAHQISVPLGSQCAVMARIGRRLSGGRHVLRPPGWDFLLMSVWINPGAHCQKSSVRRQRMALPADDAFGSC